MIQDALDKVREIFSPTHDEVVTQLAALRAKHAKAGAARKAQIEVAQAAVAELEAPRRRLERLQAEAIAADTHEEHEAAALENPLRERPTRDLQVFDAVHARVLNRYRNMEAPSPDVAVNWITDESRVTNLAAIESWREIGPLLVRISVERRDTLWLLASGELRARLAALRAELEAALAGTSLEVELG